MDGGKEGEGVGGAGAEGAARGGGGDEGAHVELGEDRRHYGGGEVVLDLRGRRISSSSAAAATASPEHRNASLGFPDHC